MALLAIAAGDSRQLENLGAWLASQAGVKGRYLFPDIQSAIVSQATSTGDGGLEQLRSGLAGSPNTRMFAAFPDVKVGGVLRLDGAWVGARSDVCVQADLEPVAAGLAEVDPDRLVVVVDHPAQGRLGAIRNTAWLQTVLGAVSLASHAAQCVPPAVAPFPGHRPAMFVRGEHLPPEPSDTVVLAPGEAAVDIAALLSGPTRDVLLDATAQKPTDLVQGRLTRAARWLQIAAAAVTHSDSIVALGIALETIANDANEGAVVEKVTKRAAVFLAGPVDPDDRPDVYQDRRAEGQRLYGLRSRAAHGQLDDFHFSQEASDAQRAEFRGFVMDVALGFRDHARARRMQTDEDFVKWWKRAEVHGLFT